MKTHAENSGYEIIDYRKKLNELINFPDKESNEYFDLGSELVGYAKSSSTELKQQVPHILNIDDVLIKNINGLFFESIETMDFVLALIILDTFDQRINTLMGNLSNGLKKNYIKKLQNT
jgi:hypothetical protein